MHYEVSFLDLSAQVGKSLQQGCGLFWVQSSTLKAGLVRFILHSSPSCLDTGEEGVHLIIAQTVHKVVLLPTGHQDGHLCDTSGLSFVGFAVSYSIFQRQSSVGFQDWFLPFVSA